MGAEVAGNLQQNPVEVLSNVDTAVSAWSIVVQMHIVGFDAESDFEQDFPEEEDSTPGLPFDPDDDLSDIDGMEETFILVMPTASALEVCQHIEKNKKLYTEYLGFDNELNSFDVLSVSVIATPVFVASAV